MRCKKGVVEVQFNWIFILIAGALILLFFTTIILKQKSSTETKIDISLVSSLQSIISGSGTVSKLADIKALPRISVGFDCDSFSIGDLRQSVGKDIVFSPDFLDGRNLVIRTWDWNIPFRITNFLYLTVPQVRYIFVEDGTQQSTDLKNILMDALPPTTIKGQSAMNWEFVESGALSGLNEQNNYKVRFVFLYPSPVITNIPTEFNSLKEDLTAIVIKNYESAPIENGDLDFYNYNAGSLSLSSSSKYVGTASLLGAIFSEDADTYNCIMLKAFERAEFVADVYRRRSAELNAEYSGSGACENIFSQAENLAGNLKSLAGQLSSSNPLDQFPDSTTIGNLKTAIQSLKDQNRLARASCASVY